MFTEKIGEPIRVVAAFSGGSIKPLRFRCQGRTYQIETINGRWFDRRTDGYSLHYSVQVGQMKSKGVEFDVVGQITDRLSVIANGGYTDVRITEDADAAKRFYTKLFGWRIQLSPTGSYTALRRGTPIAGISQIDDTLPETEESMWLAAIVVSDLPAAVAAARRLGATIHEDVTRVPGYGSYANTQSFWPSVVWLRYGTYR